MTTFTVRIARLEDSAAIARVHIASATRGEAGIMPASWLAWVAENEAFLADLWTKRLGAPDRNRVYVADDDGEIVGYVRLRPADLPGEDALELHLIYVAPERWGTGVAAALMRAAVDHIRERGKPAIVWPAEANQRSRRFYEKCGWQLDGARDVMTLHGIDVPIVRYRLR